MIRPDLSPVGEPGFVLDLDADRRGAWHAYACLIVATVAVTISVLAYLWWLDRVADPPAFRPTIQPRASWLDGPRQVERSFAKLEQPDQRP